ncbi:MAG: HPr family phosphocarrier protein [Anaerolineae bacterium]|nr:HPr family phosphocarrier protein [Anaerolineae bacterium]
MPEVTLTIKHEAGLHARPGALFVKTAKQFESDITVVFTDKQANAKSILSLLSLGVEKGSVITIRTEGEDAGAAVNALKALVESNFGEGE